MKSRNNTARAGLRKTARRLAKNTSRLGRNARQGLALAAAAGTVVQRRTQDAAAALVSPNPATAVEMSRIVPEKIIAFTAAGLQASRHIVSGVFWWNSVVARECAALTTRTGAQAAMTAWPRMAATALEASARVMQAQHAICAPLLRTAKANAVRLAG